MGLRGVKPLTDCPREHRVLYRVKEQANRVGVVDLYVAPDGSQVYVRDANPGIRPYSLPPTAVLVGRYSKPVPREVVLDDLREVLAGVRT